MYISSTKYVSKYGWHDTIIRDFEMVSNDSYLGNTTEMLDNGATKQLKNCKDLRVSASPAHISIEDSVIR